MTTATSTATEEARIREIIDRLTRAVRDKDIDAVMAHYAPDMLAFDAVPPLRITADAYRNNWEQCFAWHEGPVGYEIRDLNITAGEDVAFCHGLIGMSGTGKDGEKNEFWGRMTACFRKIDGKWMITHEHSSAPFDCETGKALMDLKP